MNRFFITLSMLLICLIANAQNIAGTITVENGHPIEFVTVSLRSLPDSAIVAGCITDEKGHFEIHLVPEGFKPFGTNRGDMVTSDEKQFWATPK